MGSVFIVCIAFIDVLISDVSVVESLNLSRNAMTLYRALSWEGQKRVRVLAENGSRMSYGGMSYNTCMEIAEHHPQTDVVFIGPFSSHKVSRGVFDSVCAKKHANLKVMPFYLDTPPGMCYVIPNGSNRCIITDINPEMVITKKMIELLFMEIDKEKKEKIPEKIIVYVAGYTIETSPAMQEIAQKKKAGALPSLLCTNLSDPGVLKRAPALMHPFVQCSDWVIGNRAEFEELYSTYHSDPPPTAAALYSAVKAHTHNAVITEGAKAVTVIYQKNGISCIEKFVPPQIEVANPTGAGDVFAGTFLSKLVSGLSVPESIEAAVLRTSKYLQTNPSN